MKKAAIFDWDGVIVDSSAQHEKSWERLAEETGLPLFEGHFQQSFGMKNQDIIPNILKWSDDPARCKQLSDRKEEHYRDILREDGIEPLPGVLPFLNALKQADIPCVVGSSTDRLNIETIIEMTGLEGYFLEIISSENVKIGKPHPDVFLKAAQAAGADPEHCVVFEDAHTGIEAGLAAGMKVVAVTSTRPREMLKHAHIIVDRLDELDVKSLIG